MWASGHIADYVLVGSKVRYLSNFSAAPHFGERPDRRGKSLIGIKEINP
jgi:hypothetical protein